MKIDDRRRHLLFPTPIWQFMFEGCEELNAQLYQDIMAFDWEGYKQAHNRISISFNINLVKIAG